MNLLPFTRSHMRVLLIEHRTHNPWLDRSEQSPDYPYHQRDVSVSLLGCGSIQIQNSCFLQRFLTIHERHLRTCPLFSTMPRNIRVYQSSTTPGTSISAASLSQEMTSNYSLLEMSSPIFVVSPS